jgi:hypothetical protein
MAYLLKCSDLYFGLAPRAVRMLAFEFAQKLKLKVPGWEEDHIAGVEWFRNFMLRHPKLSIRKPQATSLARAKKAKKGSSKPKRISKRRRVNKSKV